MHGNWIIKNLRFIFSEQFSTRYITDKYLSCIVVYMPRSHRFLIQNFRNATGRLEVNHHHHWLDSPWWAVAFLRSFAHSSLLRATFFHFLTPSILIFWSTPSSHRNFGLPAFLAPSSLVLNIFLSVLSLIYIKKQREATWQYFY